MRFLSCLILFFLLFSQCKAQCDCSWIKKHRNSPNLPTLYKEVGIRTYDELTVGFFRKATGEGTYLINGEGNPLFPNRFDKIEEIYEDSNFLAIKQGEKFLYKLWATDSLRQELREFSDIWFIRAGEFFYRKSDTLLIRNPRGEISQAGYYRNDTLFLDETPVLSILSKQFFLKLLMSKQYTTVVRGLTFETLLLDKLIFADERRHNFYSLKPTNTSGERAEFQSIEIFDTLYWGRETYFIGNDGETVFYLPVKPEGKAYAIPFNRNFKSYKKLKPKNFTGRLQFPAVIYQGNKSMVFLADTILDFEGRMEVVDNFNEETSLITLNGRVGIFNIDSLVLYQLKGGVVNVTEACPLYIVTVDKRDAVYIYSLAGREIRTTNKRGYLLGSYYFDENSGEVLFEVQ